MRTYYASRLSEHISQTPDGYLICKDVPIARTGVQEYFGEELGLAEYRGQKLAVQREESEVFDPATLASFEGKPVTDGHPDEDVTADNYGVYLKGITKEVRRGSGEDSDKIIADLIVYDRRLAEEIQGGKREISCGYNFECKEGEDGQLYQCKIRGNHVAVVLAGRAGSQVRIKDSAPGESKILRSERSKKDMAKGNTKKKNSIFAGLFPVLAKDSDPEAVREVLENIEEALTPGITDEETSAAPQETVPPPATDDEEMPVWAKAITEQIAQLNARLDAAAAKDTEDPIQQLEDELTGEKEVSLPPEQIEDEETNDCDTTSDEEIASDIDPAADEDVSSAVTDSLLKLVRDMKPVIANMKDAKAKKRATDALVRTVRGIKGLPKKRLDGYAVALDAKAQVAKVRDRAGESFDMEKIQAAYDKRNPHKQH